ncbi:SET-binding protein [Chanos chanos]|uniref:SET-binding protein n=1 Tax=Chanos chanos TaxID=29144 RepID=A0A6J2WTQ3_CHACN|nr:SET-binding protein [Chanos chanos]
MEPRELARTTRPKGVEAEFYPGASLVSRSSLAEVPGNMMPNPGKELPVSRDQLDHEEDEDLGLGKDMDASSNADSEKWSQGDGLEEQEFSIKEASFSEGSLKLKIQTTKRAKKPPKSLENYICPPEIRITIKPPTDQKTTKHGKSNKTGKDEDKGPPRKRTYERTFKLVDQNDNNTMDILGDNIKPKHDMKSSDIHQLDWTKPTAVELLSHQEHRTDSESKRESACTNKSLLSDPTIPFLKTQVKKVSEGSSTGHIGSGIPGQGPASQASSAEDTTLSPPADTSLLMLSSFSKDRGSQEVTDQVFGNSKRKYVRRDSMRALGNHSSELHWLKKTDRDSDPLAMDNTKEKQSHGPEICEPHREESEDNSKKPEGENKVMPICVHLQTDESKGRKRRNRRLTEDHVALEEEQVTRSVESSDKADQSSGKPKVANKVDVIKAKQFGVSQVDMEDGIAVKANNLEMGQNRHRKNPVGRPRSVAYPGKQADEKQPKVKDRWSYLKAKSSAPHQDINPILSIEEPPSAFPITPASPLYTNTNSLTVITPVKKKRGRPKKQPLLTVETIHEGTATSPVSPIAQDPSATSKRRRKKHNLSKLVQLALNKSSSAHQMKLTKTGHVGVLKKRTVKKMKLVKMQSILNELLSSSSNGNLALKSNAPVSNAMSAMASTIEARLGKQINVSKRGTIYIGKKRGRKPRVDTQTQHDEHKASDKHSLPVSSPLENLVVPSNPSSTTGMPSPRVMPPLSAQSLGACGMPHPPSTDTSQHDLKTMPNLQPISALPTKTPKSLLSSNWKLSPPRLMANSPSHLSEVASIKEVTLSPVSESHSEETIPSDSGIGTDNNSTSDQAEKGPASRRRYSFDLCSFEAAEAAALEATSKAARGHYQKRATAVAVENFLAQESLKRQKHRRKRKNLQSRDDLQFLADLEELISKFQVFRISHRSYSFYRENSYPSIFRLNFDHYYPMPFFPYDPVHYLRRSSEKSKRRRGRPAKSNETMTKMPFIQGYGYPVPSGNYYAPYAMPYTSMPLATSMMNMGYYGQYPPHLYLSHSLGPSGSSLMRPPVPPPKFHSGGPSNLAAASRHRTKSTPHELPSSGMKNSQSTFMALKGSSSCLASVCHHKRKHKHKHKYKEDQYSMSQREDLGGLFSGAQNPAYLSLLNERLEKSSALSKLKDKQRDQQSTDVSSKSSRNYFEVDTLSSLTLSDSQHCKRTGGEIMNNFLNVCGRQPHERMRAGQDRSLDLFKGQHIHEQGTSIRSRRRSLEDYGTYSESSRKPFSSEIQERTKPMFQCPNASLPEPSSLKIRYKRKEEEEIQQEVRKVCSFSKILTTKKSLDHVNKILRVKRLQRQAKTGNNVVKRRRGRPRKQPLDHDQGVIGQMPVLEKCVDLPGKRNPQNALMPEPLEFSNHDSIMDAIESVVHRARSQSVPQSAEGGKHWPKAQTEGALERPRRSRGSKKDEIF